jgi:ferredoxin
MSAGSAGLCQAALGRRNSSTQNPETGVLIGTARRRRCADLPIPFSETVMSSPNLPVGSFVRIEKPELQAIINKLQQLGYRTVGPRVSEGAIIYDDLTSVEELPVGYLDEQDGGKYRLRQTGENTWFDYVVGPHSLKNFLFPPREVVLECERIEGHWQMREPDLPTQPLAVIGPRSCDLHALRVQDRVFLGDQYVDQGYKARREGLFIAAVNCRRAAATCFCHSMKTGPAITFGFDLGLTELPEHFVVEIGTPRGGEVVVATNWSPCSMAQIERAKALPQTLKRQMQNRPARVPGSASDQPQGRSLDTTDIRDLLLNNLEHPRWHEVAERCLACGNCTLVCPTCFCSTVEEVTDLTGDHVERERSWASCFMAEHSYMNSGTVRKSTHSRYRQWLTHKLATWFDQFDSSGCIGCGRCITWCPVGIDLTEEVAAIRGNQP